MDGSGNKPGKINGILLPEYPQAVYKVSWLFCLCIKRKFFAYLVYSFNNFVL